MDLAPVLNAAGWHQLSAVENPTTTLQPGNWNVWQNVTGLAPGATTLGEELRLLYGGSEILSSSVRDQLDLVWDGAEFG